VGSSGTLQNGAASASAQYAQSPGTRCHIHGFGAGQWRAHLVALHHCEIRPEFTFFVASRLPLLQFPVTYEIGRYTVLTARAGRVQKRAGLFECGERLAGLRADPNFAAFEHFFFPDRHGLFDFFNGEAASRECRVAVRR